MSQDMPISIADLRGNATVQDDRRGVLLLGSTSRFVALLTAWVATGGSLFFSEVLHWIPCTLCWYQRIFMYPLSIILAVGLLRRERGIHLYVLPFSLTGAVTSLYHYLLQKTDWLPPPACSVGVPCTVDYINLLGFITIPFLALTAFLIISLMTIASALSGTEECDAGQTNSQARGWLATDRIGVLAIVGFVIASYFAVAQLL